MCERAKRYRHRAEELRTIASEMKDEKCRDTLLKCADEYEEFAEQRETAEQQLAEARPN